jgi:hypothetical protein
MEASYPTRRREIRFPAKPGTIVEVNRDGVPDRATTRDISFSGILLEFDHPITLAIGDWVTLDFARDASSAVPLPYWGVGQVVRIEGNDVAFNFDIESLVRLNWATSQEVDPEPPEPANHSKH